MWNIKSQKYKNENGKTVATFANGLSVRNIELVKTYYAGKKSPQPERKKFFSIKNKILWAAVPLLIIASAAAGLFYYYISLGGAPQRPVLLSPQKRYASIAYYNYADIKNKLQPFALGGGYNVAALNLGGPVNLSEKVLSFTAKSQSGTENVAIVFKDANNLSNANPEDKIIASGIPSDKWQVFKIDLSNIYLPLDKTRISQVRFDAADNLTNNGGKTVVYIREIAVE